MIKLSDELEARWKRFRERPISKERQAEMNLKVVRKIKKSVEPIKEMAEPVKPAAKCVLRRKS